MKKIITLTILFFVLFLSITNAQGIKKTGGFTRLESFGNNPYVFDPFFNTVNPAWNSVYDNFILLELGSVSNQGPYSAGGAGQYLSTSFRLNKEWTVGGILSRNDFFGYSIALLDPGSTSFAGTPYTGVVNAVNNLVGTGAVIPLDNNVELMGTFTADHTTIGLGVAYASTSNDFNPPTGGSSEGSASQIGVNLGALTDLSNSFKLDLGASLLLPSASFMPPTGNETKASQTIIFVNGRAFWKASQKVTLVPIVGFTTASGTVDSGGTSNGSVDMNSFTAFGVGLGANYSVGDFLLAGGLMFSTGTLTMPSVANVSPELNLTTTVFPLWNFGIEWNMVDWLVARVGYTAYSGSVTNENAATSTTTSENVYSFFHPAQRGATLGLGFHFGDFSLDATINEDVLRQGLGNFGATNGNGPTFALLTSSYALP